MCGGGTFSCYRRCCLAASAAKQFLVQLAQAYKAEVDALPGAHLARTTKSRPKRKRDGGTVSSL